MSERDTARGPVRRFSARPLGAAAVGVAMAIASVLGSIGLSNQLFWDDEANTAIYARNLVNLGRLTAFDGTNLVSYALGGALGADLGQELRVPALPAYVAAAGMTLFGQNTFGGRVPFVGAGVLSLALLAVWLKRHFGRRFPWWLPSLILSLSPAYLLYIRNCRYYSLSVMFTLLVWVFWAPGPLRGGRSTRSLADWRLVLRCIGGAIAMALLISSHYLNAALVLLTLPVFFLDRRYRQPKQYVLLGVLYATAAACGAWILVTANPLAAEYVAAGDWLFGALPQTDRFTRFYRHLWWLLRDLGSHEFVPWLLLLLLPVPWLPRRWMPRAVRRLRPMAFRGMILLLILLLYVVLTSLFTPADMAKGPFAEMRYVVPLLAVGATLGAVGLAILWRFAPPLATLAFLLLVTSNFLHLGFVVKRPDGTRSWWPPMLYRYVQEVCLDYTTGHEAMIELLGRLPAGTTVRVWPPHMIYPPMFYVPKLHYCDQLTESKTVDADLGSSLPDYLYTERARPDVVFVPAPFLERALGVLSAHFGSQSYRLTKMLSPHWNYTSKPEIPAHFFSAPPPDWLRFPGIAVLVSKESGLATHPALLSNANDAEAIHRMALALLAAGDVRAAATHLDHSIDLDPHQAEPHFHLGFLLLEQGETEQAIGHFNTALRIEPDYAEAHLYLGEALESLNQPDDACGHYEHAARLRPDWPLAHVKLGNLLAEQREIRRAAACYRAAVELDPNFAHARVELAKALLELDRVDQAVIHLQAALRIEPELVDVHLQLARAFLARGNRQGARAEFHVALKLIPADSPSAARIRAILHDLGG